MYSSFIGNTLKSEVLPEVFNFHIEETSLFLRRVSEYIHVRVIFKNLLFMVFKRAGFLASTIMLIAVN